MKIRMVQERTGPRWDGRAWPPRGGELYVDAEEGAAVCGAGWAVPVPGDGAEAPEATLTVTEETRGAESPAEPSALPRPPASAPKADWVAYAAVHGMSEAEAAALSKADLIAALG